MKSANVRPLIHSDGSERAPLGATFYTSKDEMGGRPIRIRMFQEDGTEAKYVLAGTVPDYMAKSALWAAVIFGVLGYAAGCVAGWFAIHAIWG